MHHKRGRPKNQRAGCLLCKPHKRNGVSEAESMTPSTRREAQDDVEALMDEYEDDQLLDLIERGASSSGK